MKMLLLVICAGFLSGCKDEVDNSDVAMVHKYFSLHQAFDECIGISNYNETFEQRLACTQAVYGGGT